MSTSTAPVFRHEFVIIRTVARDVIKAILHSILFQRVFGSIQPKTIEVLGLTFPQVIEPGTERLVEERTESLFKALDHKTSQILSLRFLEKRSNRDSKPWYQTAEEDVIWERWEIGFTIHHQSSQSTTAYQLEGEREKIIKSIKSQLADFLSHQIGFVVSQRDHIPAITSSEVVPFPVDIIIHPATNGKERA
ncbi:hypothetical protein CROQUDRAFT_725432 [Cronartium quercuum f. sp. fusiforme G11]|uniref:Autophagy-related protein 101 n=1 Tax=Cronartium quercuum f. sp. fusiforme G11 TaxID=708437 RepID=A0A9P6T8W0_9BASI|nr:hypothetical protein CROQUDRAFT_725432 [Cronartium quercuum f. sp. fusiforme G11]